MVCFRTAGVAILKAQSPLSDTEEQHILSLASRSLQFRDLITAGSRLGTTTNYGVRCDRRTSTYEKTNPLLYTFISSALILSERIMLTLTSPIDLDPDRTIHRSCLLESVLDLLHIAHQCFVQAKGCFDLSISP